MYAIYRQALNAFGIAALLINLFFMTWKVLYLIFIGITELSQ